LIDDLGDFPTPLVKRLGLSQRAPRNEVLKAPEKLFSLKFEFGPPLLCLDLFCRHEIWIDLRPRVNEANLRRREE
jgi:hypothetical protein